MPRSEDQVKALSRAASSYVMNNQETLQRVALGSAVLATTLYPFHRAYYGLFGAECADDNVELQEACASQASGYLTYVGSWVVNGLMTTASAHAAAEFGPGILDAAEQNLRGLLVQAGLLKAEKPHRGDDAVANTSVTVADESEVATEADSAKPKMG